MSTSREKKGAVFLLIILLILLVATVVIALSLRTNPVAEKLEEDQMIRLLLVMHDGNGNALSTDAFVYYPPMQRGALFDIPGNTGGIYESIDRTDRIDAVYTERGVSVYKREIEKLTDMEIPFTLEISLADLAPLTDLLGGMKVFVPSPVDSVGPNGERWLLPSGAVNLDGDKIQTYMQYMLPYEEDDDKEERQQNVVIALLGALKENSALIFNKKNFPYYGKAFKANVDGDGLYRLLELISNVDSERLSPVRVTGNINVVGGKRLLFPYYGGDLIRDMVKRAVNMLVSGDTIMHGRVYAIEILNGTTVQGLARNTSALLRPVGYDVLQTGNAPRNDIEHTLIINHIGNAEVAKSLGDFIHCYNIEDEEVRPESAGMDSAEVDMTLVLGRDFDGRFVRGGYGKKDRETTPPRH